MKYTGNFKDLQNDIGWLFYPKNEDQMFDVYFRGKLIIHEDRGIEIENVTYALPTVALREKIFQLIISKMVPSFTEMLVMNCNNGVVIKYNDWYEQSLNEVAPQVLEKGFDILECTKEIQKLKEERKIIDIVLNERTCKNIVKLWEKGLLKFEELK